MNDNFKLIPCKKEHWEFVRSLRNNDKVKSGFINEDYISKEVHFKFMTKHSKNYRISMFNNKLVGYVGIIENSISVCTIPDFQGRGMGKFMINEIIKIWPSAYAKVKINNSSSLKMFEACGFEKKFYILKKK